MWRNWNPLALLMGTCDGATLTETRMEVPQNTKNAITMLPRTSTSGYKPKIITISISKRQLHPCSLQHYCNNQMLEATQVSINQWMDKHSVVDALSGVWFRLEKEGHNRLLDKRIWRTSRWVKYASHKGTNLVAFHLGEAGRIVKIRDRKQNAGYQGW